MKAKLFLSLSLSTLLVSGIPVPQEETKNFDLFSNSFNIPKPNPDLIGNLPAVIPKNAPVKLPEDILSNPNAKFQTNKLYPEVNLPEDDAKKEVLEGEEEIQEEEEVQEDESYGIPEKAPLGNAPEPEVDVEEKEEEEAAEEDLNTPYGNPPDPVTENENKTKDSNDSEIVPISETADISTLITDGIIFLIKNNLCSSLGGELTSTCEQVSNTIINTISKSLVDLLKSTLSKVSNGGIDAVCALIPNEVFKNLTDLTITSISRELEKKGNPDAEKVKVIGNNILNVIVNSVENLLCNGRKNTESIGDMITKGISGLAANIINGFNQMNNDVKKMSFKMDGSPKDITSDIADSFSQIQEAFRSMEPSIRTQPVEVETPNYEEYYQNHY